MLSFCLILKTEGFHLFFLQIGKTFSFAAKQKLFYETNDLEKLQFLCKTEGYQNLQAQQKSLTTFHKHECFLRVKNEKILSITSVKSYAHGKYEQK